MRKEDILCDPSCGKSVKQLSPIGDVKLPTLNGRLPMNRLVLALALSLLTLPALAHPKDPDKYKDKDWDKDSITANEMVPSGLAVAGLIGVGGYLILRRRRARSHAS